MWVGYLLRKKECNAKAVIPFVLLTIVNLAAVATFGYYAWGGPLNEPCWIDDETLVCSNEQTGSESQENITALW